MSLSAPALLRETVKAAMPEGPLVPRLVARDVSGALTNIDKLAIFEWALPGLVRSTLQGLRFGRDTDQTGDRIFVPDVGWKVLADLTADDCDAVAADYERLASDNRKWAEWYRDVATQIRASGVPTLWGLSWYKQMISERTKFALRELRDMGVQLGRPPVLGNDVRERIRQLRKSGKTLQEIADELNTDGTPSGHGGVWHPQTIRRICGDTPRGKRVAA